jgi:hypothetical protein
VPNPISSMRLGTEYGDKPLAGNHGYILGTDESPPVCRQSGSNPVSSFAASGGDFPLFPRRRYARARKVRLLRKSTDESMQPQPLKKLLDKRYTIMIISVMLARQVTLLDPLRATLTPLFRYSCKLFIALAKVKSFAIKQIHTLSAKYRGVGYLCDVLESSPSSQPFSFWPSRIHNSRAFSSLRPLCVSWLSFATFHPLFSIGCSLFCKNRGVGVGRSRLDISPPVTNTKAAAPLQRKRQGWRAPAEACATEACAITPGLRCGWGGGGDACRWLRRRRCRLPGPLPAGRARRFRLDLPCS